SLRVVRRERVIAEVRAVKIAADDLAYVDDAGQLARIAQADEVCLLCRAPGTAQKFAVSGRRCGRRHPVAMQAAAAPNGGEELGRIARARAREPHARLQRRFSCCSSSIQRSVAARSQSTSSGPLCMVYSARLSALP